MIERGYFGRAMQIVASDPATYVLGGLILFLLSVISLGMLSGPGICGLVWVTLKRIRGEEVTFADLFRGFDNVTNTALTGLVFWLLIGGGFAFGIVPGIIAGALFCFVFPFVVDRDMLLPEAMTASRTLKAGEDLLDRSLFFLLAFLLGISGTVFLVVGLLFTWPLMWAVVAVAYDDLCPPPPAPDAS